MRKKIAFINTSLHPLGTTDP
jgi:hypothetical protein